MDASFPPPTSNLLLALPTHVWRHVLRCYGYKDHTLAGRTCRYLHALWTEAVEKGTLPLFVPVDCKTLKEAVNRVHGDDRLTTIVVGKGEYQIDAKYLKIGSAMNLVGDPGVPKSEIVVVGGIQFKKGIPGTCHLQHLTLRQAKRSGVEGGSSFTMEDVLVEQCAWYGVNTYGTGGVGRCTNLEVRQCGGSGVLAQCEASITLIGAKTTVHHNCTKGDRGDYGLQAYGPSSSTIQLVSPLTKEQVSLDNGGGGNWGAEWGGDINQIKTIAAVIALETIAAAIAPANETHANRGTPRDVLQTLPTFMQKQILAFFGYKDCTLTGRTCQYLKRLWTKAVEKGELPLFVPVDCKTLKEAVNRVHGDKRLTTIVVGKGEHRIDRDYLEIPSAMNIVGDPGPGVPKSEIVVVGGCKFGAGIQGHCRLQHLTLRQAKNSGVWGKSSFTMDDVLVEQCGGHGVVAYGTGVVGRCTNVEVRQCVCSGVSAYSGASITLIGAKTTSHHNCTTGRSDHYGLKVYGSSSSTLQLVSPLTKEQVSLDNGGGGNWGADGGGDITQIKTVSR